MTKNIAVLGAGMAGLGAAHRLGAEGITPKLFEKNAHPGGHTASHLHPGGFIFDEGPHISFTKESRIQQLFSDNVGGNFEVLDSAVNNYWQGHWVKHPAQVNLHGLPVDLVTNAIKDFVGAAETPIDMSKIDNYEQWLRASFGDTFAETFPMQYGKKYHTTEASNMSTVWLGPRLYRPELEELLRGALTNETEEVHYVSDFRYPSEGGFVSYIKPFLDVTEFELSHELVRLDPKAKQLLFANGNEYTYDGVVSSIPLPELIPLIDDVPKDVVEAAAALACTNCVLVNLGINRSDVSPAHWTYFYDDDMTMTRLSFPHMLSPNNVPAGHGSFQAEVYFSKKYRPLEKHPDEYVQPVIDDLKRCGLLREDDEIVFKQSHHIPYANVIFDHDREQALPIVHAFLDEIGVGYCGRYGEWGYHWTDQSFMSGEETAQQILDA